MLGMTPSTSPMMMIHDRKSLSIVVPSGITSIRRPLPSPPPAFPHEVPLPPSPPIHPLPIAHEHEAPLEKQILAASTTPMVLPPSPPSDDDTPLPRTRPKRLVVQQHAAVSPSLPRRKGLALLPGEPSDTLPNDPFVSTTPILISSTPPSPTPKYFEEERLTLSQLQNRSQEDDKLAKKKEAELVSRSNWLSEKIKQCIITEKERLESTPASIPSSSTTIISCDVPLSPEILHAQEVASLRREEVHLKSAKQEHRRHRRKLKEKLREVGDIIKYKDVDDGFDILGVSMRPPAEKIDALVAKMMLRRRRESGSKPLSPNKCRARAASSLSCEVPTTPIPAPLLEESDFVIDFQCVDDDEPSPVEEDDELEFVSHPWKPANSCASGSFFSTSPPTATSLPSPLDDDEEEEDRDSDCEDEEDWIGIPTQRRRVPSPERARELVPLFGHTSLAAQSQMVLELGQRRGREREQRPQRAEPGGGGHGGGLRSGSMAMEWFPQENLSWMGLGGDSSGGWTDIPRGSSLFPAPLLAADVSSGGVM